MNHEDYMFLALEQAEIAAQIGEVPVGAVGVYQGEVIAQAHNLREKAQDPTAHAELLVLLEVSRHFKSWRLKDLILYVTLEPCIMCMGALLQARIKQLVFGAMDPKAGASGSLYNLASDSRLNHQIDVVSGVKSAQSEELLKGFFQNLRLNEKGAV